MIGNWVEERALKDLAGVSRYVNFYSIIHAFFTKKCLYHYIFPTYSDLKTFSIKNYIFILYNFSIDKLLFCSDFKILFNRRKNNFKMVD